jgi:hypothetical protein
VDSGVLAVVPARGGEVVRADDEAPPLITVTAADPKDQPLADAARAVLSAHSQEFQRLMDNQWRRMEYFLLWGRWPDEPFETFEDMRRELAKEKP